MTATDVLYPETSSLASTVEDLLDVGGYGGNTDLQTQMLNYIGYVNLTVVSGACSANETQDECFTTLNATNYQDTSYAFGNSRRSWDYQVCTEWGYIQTGDTPKSILPLISRTLNLDYLTFFCRAEFNITTPSDVHAVNKYGGFDITYSRLAIIGGQADPWRPATPLADEARKRVSSTNHPVLEIPDAVHHWEENGLFANETTATLPPNAIVYAQEFEKDFVVQWLAEFEADKKKKREVGFES